MNETFATALQDIGYKEAGKNRVNLTQDNNTHSGLAPLTFYSVVAVSGSDASQFLQNQFSNDIKLLSETKSQLNSYSSAKGMMYGNFRILKNGDIFLLRLSADTADTIIKRLTMFKLRDDVTLTQPDVIVLGVAGENSDAQLKALGLPTPTETDGVSTQDEICVVKCIHRDDSPRYEIYAPVEKAITLIKKAEYADVPLVGSNTYLAHQIQDGEAVITEPTYEQFVAQMLNLERINGVSFKKGCYPGQEYIARTQYRGQVRSRTYIIKADKEDVLSEGQDVFAEGTTPSVGTVLNVANIENECVATAIVRTKQAQSSTLFVKDEQSHTEHSLNTLPLPYSLEDEEA